LHRPRRPNTQVWNHRHPGRAGSFEPGTPWLLRYFDRITFYPVTAAELADLRADMAAGRGHVDITDGEFSLAGTGGSWRPTLTASPRSAGGRRWRSPPSAAHGPPAASSPSRAYRPAASSPPSRASR